MTEFIAPDGFLFDYWNHFSHLPTSELGSSFRCRPYRIGGVMGTRVVVTGGGGFIGAYLVKRLVCDGWDVAVVDTMVRGDPGRIAEVADHVELFTCDVRDEQALERAFAGAEVIMHLAAINGTENFYKRPELVLDVGLRGALAVVNAGRNAGVADLVVASTAEVYQTPAIVPTPETVALTLPDTASTQGIPMAGQRWFAS